MTISPQIGTPAPEEPAQGTLACVRHTDHSTNNKDCTPFLEDNRELSRAGVAELVDALDLGSRAFSFVAIEHPMGEITVVDQGFDRKDTHKATLSPTHVGKDPLGSTMVTMVELQTAQELKALRRGIDRDAKEQAELVKRGEIASHPSYQGFVRGSLKLVSEELTAALVGTKGPHITPLLGIDPDLISYAGLWVTVNAISKDTDVRNVCLRIGAMIEDHIWGETLANLDKPQFTKVYAKVKSKHTNARSRKKALTPLSKKLGVTLAKWTPTLKIRVGGFVLNALLRAGIVTMRPDHEGTEHLDFSSHALEALADLSSSASWLRPVNMPMLVAPKPWRGWDDGGYLTKVCQTKNPLVRSGSRQHRTMVEQAIKSGAMAQCLEALNTIQATPWRINSRMLEMVTWCHDNHVLVEGLPRAGKVELPSYPANFADLPLDEQKKHRRGREDARRRNTTIQGQAATFRTDIAAARDLAEQERFWMPHSLDFRGRVYPIPHFSPQRCDYVKGMLEFAEGVELTSGGLRWLMIHLANCGDFEKVSKKPFEDRIAWVKANETAIYSVAFDPKTDLSWTEADKPFEYLRACIEYVDAHTFPFISHLPVQIDGSNSGLQHYSAILRAEDDGKHVNLVPSPVPADVYAEVARRVLEATKTSSDPQAQTWLAQGITRKTVKRNVMTFPYSSETYGFREQLMEDLMTPLANDVLDGKLATHPFGDDGGWAAAGYLSREVFKAVNETVSAASGAMKWLRNVAGVLAHEAQGLSYSTPVGFPVLHQYTEFEAKRVSLFLFDKSIPVAEAASRDVIKEEGVYRRIVSNLRAKPTRVIIKAKQKSAVAPNVIHSMDAAHLMLTAVAASARGVPDFALVHDSFGCHASHMPTLFLVVRETMASMYAGYCPLETIEASAIAALSEKGQLRLTPRPPRGNLDLTQLTSCDFAFA